MKSTVFFKLAMMAIVLTMVACKSSQSVEKQPEVDTAAETVSGQQFLHKVADNAQYAKYITSKAKFRVQIGSKDISLSGSLHMKRDDVIRLQLVAFGIVEAARLEFTTDYVLIMDRINKQYIKVPYDKLDFLGKSGLSFYSLQALFWNELFQPGTTKLTDSQLKDFTTTAEEAGMTISFDKGKLAYKWVAAKDNALIKSANVKYKDGSDGGVQLNWDYKDFKKMGSKQFPSGNTITVTTPKKEVRLDITLNGIDNDSDWETRTEISGKYKQADVDDILRRLTAL